LNAEFGLTTYLVMNGNNPEWKVGGLAVGEGLHSRGDKFLDCRAGVLQLKVLNDGSSDELDFLNRYKSKKGKYKICQ
jgi:hypothetical protein